MIRATVDIGTRIKVVGSGTTIWTIAGVEPDSQLVQLEARAPDEDQPPAKAGKR